MSSEKTYSGITDRNLEYLVATVAADFTAGIYRRATSRGEFASPWTIAGEVASILGPPGTIGNHSGEFLSLVSRVERSIEDLYLRGYLQMTFSLGSPLYRAKHPTRIEVSK